MFDCIVSLIMRFRQSNSLVGERISVTLPSLSGDSKRVLEP